MDLLLLPIRVGVTQLDEPGSDPSQGSFVHFIFWVDHGTFIHMRGGKLVRSMTAESAFTLRKTCTVTIPMEMSWRG